MTTGVRGRETLKGVRGSGKDRGAVTAEFAVALPAVLLLLALLLAGSAAGITQLRLEEAARAGARALARGEDAGAVQGIVRQLAGASASSSIVAEGEWLSVTVSGKVSGPVGSMMPWTLSARALARGETARSASLHPAESPSMAALPVLALSGIVLPVPAREHRPEAAAS
ncbi:TadE family type IV pilus minor pilin [Arthrobacter sp. B10-11]|uniref:TadE family type IV pilus minor pilin n=1 Tax=Arthrobacter sp. B10-11 TaxID=3081160 RepID=UPI002952AFA1|nr:TadE family type IV pilus minor pilin [Arthrobacter sp. B10-11]MDV8147154.1 TadE family type IV pilus minor pilin [Arthrobacter sp. B10-11]